MYSSFKCYLSLAWNHPETNFELVSEAPSVFQPSAPAAQLPPQSSPIVHGTVGGTNAIIKTDIDVSTTVFVNTCGMVDVYVLPV